MTILYAPFAAKAPSLKGQPSPKNYPYPQELYELLRKDHTVIQVGGSGDTQIAEDFRTNLSFSEVSQLIGQSDTGVCVDSYLQHHFWYSRRRAVVVFGISDPIIFGHPENMNLLKDRKNLRENQYDLYYINQYNPDAFVSPEEVLTAIKSL